MLNKWTILGCLAGALNVCDAVGTLLCIANGIGVEANPAMAYLMNISIWLFLAVKIALVPLFIFIGSKAKDSLLSKVVFMSVFLLYFAEVSMQEYFLFSFWLG